MDAFFPMGVSKLKGSRTVESLMSDDVYAAQIKIDGVRATFNFQEDGSLAVTTRGATFENPDCPIDITHRVSHLVNFRAPKLSESCLDGEIEWAGHTAAELSGILNYRSDKSVPLDIVFKVFDVPVCQSKSLMSKPLTQREWYREKFKDALKSKPQLHFVPLVTGEYDKAKLLDRELSAGREGIVLKNLNSMYFPGKKKANTWYKVKAKDTIDVVITGAEPPEHFYRDPDTGVYDLGRVTKAWGEGWFGAISYKMENGLEGTVSGLTDQMKGRLSDGEHGLNSIYLGRIMELEFMQYTDDGFLRHARFARLRGEEEK